MRIVGVSMVSVETEAGYRKAGVSRYALNIVAAMARQAPTIRFEAYVNGRFVRPSEWSGLDNLRLHTVWKYRTHLHLAGLRSRFQSFDVWFVPNYDRLLNCPVPEVAMIHDVFPIDHPEWYSAEQRLAMQTAIDQTCRVSRILLANSESTKRAMVRFLCGSAEQIVVTPLGLGNVAPPVERSQVDREAIRELGIRFDRYILVLGTVEPRKNLARLLKAWAKIEAEHPDLGLVVVGAKGWEFEDVFKEAETSGVHERVSFPGYVSDSLLPMLFAGCELYVLASLDEGFGMPVLEAMHYGAPLALSDRGALPEVAGDLATYFDPESVQEIAAGIIKALARSAERDQLVELGKARASEFSWERAAKASLAALARACGEPA